MEKKCNYKKLETNVEQLPKVFSHIYLLSLVSHHVLLRNLPHYHVKIQLQDVMQYLHHSIKYLLEQTPQTVFFYILRIDINIFIK